MKNKMVHHKSHKDYRSRKKKKRKNKNKKRTNGRLRDFKHTIL